MNPALDADYATIGGLLLAPQQLDAIGTWLRPEDFARPLCGEVYQLVVAMRANSQPIDPVTVLGALTRDGRVRADGYPAGELIAMVEAVPSSAMTPHYARLVLEAATFRRIEQCGTRITQIGRSHRGTPNDAFETLTTTWRDLADARDRWQASQAPRSVDGKPGDRPRLVEGIDHDVATRTARAR